MSRELLLQKGRFLLTGGMFVVLGAACFEGHEFFELVSPGDQCRQGGFALAGREVASRLHDGSESAQDGGLESIRLGQATLGASEGTDPGGVVDAGGLLRCLQGGDDGTFVSPGALAHAVRGTAGFRLQRRRWVSSERWPAGVLARASSRPARSTCKVSLATSKPM